MRILMTGGSGVLGRASVPLLRAAGHQVRAPGHDQLSLFDSGQARTALSGVDAVFHMATRIPPREAQGEPDAWQENDRLRREATGILVDAALAAGARRFIFPSIAFVYPHSGPADESTTVAGDVAVNLRSALEAERHVARFTARGGRGVVLRFGLLYGPGTGSLTPAERWASYGATLRIEDAGRALAAALDAPADIYNVVRDGERVSNALFKKMTGWHPEY
jgi:nucleoside-diphosphate-sugar epimerase